jgi:transposase
VLVRDGWQSYRQFTHARHQTCLAHLLRTCRRLLLDYPAQPSVRAVKAILQAALRTQAQSRTGTISAHGLAVARGQYLERLGRLLARTPSRRLAVRRFQGHLVREHDAVFSFLFDPTLDATNWRAEQARRPAVVTRKTCGGGNRTAHGAQSQQVLTTVLRTADHWGLDATTLLATLLTAPRPTVPLALDRSRRSTDPLNTDFPTSNSQLPTPNTRSWALGVGSCALGVGLWELGLGSW